MAMKVKPPPLPKRWNDAVDAALDAVRAFEVDLTELAVSGQRDVWLQVSGAVAKMRTRIEALRQEPARADPSGSDGGV